MSETEALLRLPEVLQRCGIGRSQAYSLIARDEFPRPVRVGRNVLFVESEITAWVRDRIAESRAGANIEEDING